MAKYIPLFFALILSACNISGNYRGSGPCEGFNVDPDACERAHANSLAAPNVKIGQSIEEVSKIMGGPPARRTATQGKEEWYYLIDYDNHLSMVVVFKEEKVVEIRQATH